MVAYKKLPWIGLQPSTKSINGNNSVGCWSKFKRVLERKNKSLVHSCFFAQDACFISDSLRIKSIKLLDNTERNIFTSSEIIHSFTVRHDFRLIAVGLGTGRIVILDPISKGILRELIGHLAPVKSLGFLPGSSYLVSVSDDQSIRIWDYSTGTCISTRRCNTDFVRCLKVDLNSQNFLTASCDGTMSYWSIESESALISMDHGEPIDAICLLPGGTMAASASRSKIRFWNLVESGRLVQELVVHSKAITSMNIACEGRFLMTSSLDKSVKVIDTSSFSVAHQYRFVSPVTAICSNDTSNIICACLHDGSIVILGRSRVPSNSNLSKASDHVTVNTDSILGIVEQNFKKFKYKEALLYALESKKPQLFFSVVIELIKRGALYTTAVCLSLQEASLILEFAQAHSANPRYTTYYIDLCYLIAETHGRFIAEDERIKGDFYEILHSLSNQIEAMRQLRDVSSFIELITN